MVVAKKKATGEPKLATVTDSKLKRAERMIVDVDQDFEFLKALFYGKPKKGKTTLGASGPKPLIIDCNEKGTMSVRRVPDCKVFRASTWTDIDLAYWYLHAGKHDRQTVVIDTVTTLAQLCMKFVLGDEASRDPTKDPEMPSKREWGKVGELMKTVIINFRNLPMNVIFLAQERRWVGDEDEGEAPEIVPDVSPSVRNALTPAVDIIGRLYAKEVMVKKGGKEVPKFEYFLLVGPDEVATTGDRTGDRNHPGLPRVIRNPNIPAILKFIREGA